jgi:cytoskeleton protein RodZ
MRNVAGELLRERRHQLGLDLDAVAEILCIKPVYLAAIEQGHTEELPGPAYAVGFIRAYANYLGLDGERVIDSYREEKADVQTRPDLTLPVPLEKRGVPGGRVLLTGLVLALCGYGAWYYVGTGERERPERVAAVPAELQQLTAPARSLPASATAAAPSAPSSPTATPAAPSHFGSGLLTAPPAAGPGASNGAPPASEPAGVAVETAAASSPSAPSAGNIDIRALADSWVQIRDAGQEIVFARVLKAGETYRVPRSGLILRTGNAGALEVLVDGKPAPAIGTLGTLRRNVTLEPEALLAGKAVRG